MNTLTIISFSPEYNDVFKRLNEAWISTYFEMEPEDYIFLNNPDEYIIQKGGFILLGVVNKEVVATCAMKKTNETTYQLCKMCVSPAAQGKNIGYLLCEAAIKKGSQSGARKIYLETNSKLVPAIQLYRKLGFKRVDPVSPKYQRVDVTMELIIDSL
jgi:putative acetyltransferase